MPEQAQRSSPRRRRLVPGRRHHEPRRRCRQPARRRRRRAGRLRRQRLCADDTCDVTALARSADGVTWTRAGHPLVGDEGALGDLSLQSAGCGDVAVLGDRVHLGLLDINGWDLAVAPDGTAVAREIPRRSARSTRRPVRPPHRQRHGGRRRDRRRAHPRPPGVGRRRRPAPARWATGLDDLARAERRRPGRPGRHVPRRRRGRRRRVQLVRLRQLVQLYPRRTFAPAAIPSTVDSINPTPFGESRSRPPSIPPRRRPGPNKAPRC